MNRKHAFNKKHIHIILLICIVAVIGIVIGVFAYINKIDSTTLGRHISVSGIDVSKLTVEEATEKLAKSIKDRGVDITEDGKTLYNTNLESLGYTVDEDSLSAQLSNIMKERTAEKHIFAPQKNYVLEDNIIVGNTDEGQGVLSQNLPQDNRTASTDAQIIYDASTQEFSLQKEVQGNAIDIGKISSYLGETVANDIKNGNLENNITVELTEGFYQQPAVKDSTDLENKVTALNDELTKYKNMSVTYTFGNETEVLSPETIMSWINFDGNAISINQDAASEYISNLADKYNTIYVPRTFTNSYGAEVTIQGNEYGYMIDEDGELAQLLSDISAGTPVSRDPVYSKTGYQRNGNDDLMGSYIEVSLDNQHLWLYKDGKLVTQTDIISGAPTEDRETYRGAWPIAYKASPYTLTSDIYGYNADVKYWMPFVYGQGLHDASWQTAFGGDSYKTGAGSHGCINLPEDQAAIIYNAIDGGYPILIY